MSTEIAPTDIKTFWIAPPKKQNKIRKKLARQELEEYAVENHFIFYRGKLIKPNDYPCKCVFECPSRCQEEKNSDKGKDYIDAVCKCRCHTYYEPF